MNQAITQMDEVTQQNAALVEEAAAAAESMQEQAQNLTQAVACSSWRETATRAGVPSRPPKPKRGRRRRGQQRSRSPAKVAAARSRAAGQPRTGTDALDRNSSQCAQSGAIDDTACEVRRGQSRLILTQWYQSDEEYCNAIV